MSVRDKTFVKKLDVLAEFNEIKIELKTLGALKKHEAERYSVWYNHFKEQGKYVDKDKSKISWVGKHWEDIQEYIEGTYSDPKYSQATLRNHLEGLANVLLAIDKHKYKEVVRPYYNQGLSIQQILDKANEQTRFDERDAAILFPKKVLSKREISWRQCGMRIRKIYA